MKKRSVFVLILALVLTLTSLPGCVSSAAAESVLTDEQRNAAAMLNYITVLTQEINASKNSRLYMEEAYSSLINNTYPNAVDSRTLSQLTGLLDTMEAYRMVAVKRDRLQYIYEQNQAQAIRAAIPNPLALMSAVQSFRPSKLAASIVYMAVDSVTSYLAYTSENDLAHLKDGWALDDEEAAVLHNSRKGTFSYMIKMVGDYDLPGDLTLTESAVEEFVQWKNNENAVARIQFLESNQETYRCYGGYWLTLAESYYEVGDFAKCLNAVNTYELLGTRIFRKDYEYARILPLVITAAEEVSSPEEYAVIADRYAQSILDNSDHEDWALRYFAAQVYIDLSAKTLSRVYLQTAYDIVLDNVNYLSGTQQAKNAAYLAPVQKTAVPKDALKAKEKQIEDYNDMLEETRETELPPIYEPLLLNCELLFALQDELGLADEECAKIDGILHPNGAPLFLNYALDSRYRFAQNETPAEAAPTVEYGGTAVLIPADLLTEETAITVTVRENDGSEPAVFTDWKVEEVERETEGDLAAFRATYTSEAAKEHEWKPDAAITMEISPKPSLDLPTVRAEYTTHGTKNNWYDYLKVWEGQKNNWYDYLKVWEDSVTFEWVK